MQRQVNATHDFELELFATKDIPGITDENWLVSED